MGKKTYKHPRQYTTESFKARLHELYEDKFGLELVDYKGAYNKITLVCPIHGIFEVRACIAARGDASCKKCSGIQKREKTKIPFKEIIQRILKVHPSLLIDENQEYINTHTKINVICPRHGEFQITPNSLLNGQGCKQCGIDSRADKKRHNLEWLIIESKKIHGDKYTFENFVYKNTKTKGLVTCKKHGDFLISPDKLIYHKEGCPKCSSSKLEMSLERLLELNKEMFICQYKPEWLKPQSLDFYLPKYNIGIECQGIQHYQPVRFGGITEENAIKQLEYTQKLDKRKKELCNVNQVKLYYLKYDEDIEDFYKSIVNQE